MLNLPLSRLWGSSAVSPLPFRSQAIGTFREQCLSLHRLPVCVEGLCDALWPAHSRASTAWPAVCPRRPPPYPPPHAGEGREGDIEAREGSACNRVVFTNLHLGRMS